MKLELLYQWSFLNHPIKRIGIRSSFFFCFVFPVLNTWTDSIFQLEATRERQRGREAERQRGREAGICFESCYGNCFVSISDDFNFTDVLCRRDWFLGRSLTWIYFIFEANKRKASSSWHFFPFICFVVGVSFHVRFHRVLSGFYRPVGGLLPSWSHLIRFCINHRCRCRTGGNMKACLDRFACLLCFAMENMLSASSHAARRSMNNATGFCCCCCCCCCCCSSSVPHDC